MMNKEMKRRYEEKIKKIDEVQDKMDKLFTDMSDLYFDYEMIENMVKKDEIFKEWYKEYMEQYEKISELINNFDVLYEKLKSMKILSSKDLE